MDLENINGNENVDITTEEVTEQVTEGVVTDTTETTEVNTPQVEEPIQKTFTQEQVNDIVKQRVDRAVRSNDKKYSRIINTLQKGTGAKDLNEIEQTLSNFYQSQGIDVSQPIYDDRDEEDLANVAAQRIIDMGYDEIVSETDRLDAIGINNLSLREKYEYQVLGNERKKIEETKALKSIGVSDDEINSKDFKDFKAMFNESTPLKDVYELYSKIKPKEEVTPIGSMKNETTKDEVKEYYSPEDFDKLTDEQLNDPRIWAAVNESKSKWVKK